MLKVMTVVGTRPEIIRLSCIIKVLDKYVDHKLVHTGQNYDYELNSIFFEELEIRQPDYFLNIDSSSLGRSLGDILVKSEGVILRERPDAVLVLGDTNSSIATLMAKRMKIPTYHMEAGNRCFDANVPEEINRKMIDHIADYNLVYTEHARRNLIGEGLLHRFIYLTGSPMREVLYDKLPLIKKSKILDELNISASKYFIVSIHREENVDSKENLIKIIDALKILYKKFGFPVVVSTHPRTKKRLETLGMDNDKESILFHKPFGFFDYIYLQMNAFCTVSDSGTISEESAILGFPAVTLRRSTERPEALDAGAISLTGFDKESLLSGIRIAVSNRNEFSGNNSEVPLEYNVSNTSERVLRLIIGTAKLTSYWRNMDDFSRYDWE